MSTTAVKHVNADMSQWVGRDEPFESARARYWYQLVHPYEDQRDGQRVGLVGFACDQGVRRNQGRVGARHAPPLIRHAFGKLPVLAELQDRFDDTLSALLYDAGDVVCDDNDNFAKQILEEAQQHYADQITAIIKNKSLAVGLGGGHAMAYGSFLGLWQVLQQAADDSDNRHAIPSIGIINFDAHLDIRAADTATSGTPFRQIAEHLEQNHQPFHYCCIGVSRLSNTAALFDRAEQLGVHIISDKDCAYQPWETLAEQIKAFINQVDVLYLTIDMDSLPASVVPGVSAPAAYGIDLRFVERAVTLIMSSKKVKVADIAEINPTYDIDNQSCKVAARLLATIIEQHLL